MLLVKGVEKIIIIIILKKKIGVMKGRLEDAKGTTRMVDNIGTTIT